jgi:hypothetical protein
MLLGWDLTSFQIEIFIVSAVDYTLSRLKIKDLLNYENCRNQPISMKFIYLNL